MIYQHVLPLLGIHINQAKAQQQEENSDRRTKAEESATAFWDMLFSGLRR